MAAHQAAWGPRPRGGLAPELTPEGRRQKSLVARTGLGLLGVLAVLSSAGFLARSRGEGPGLLVAGPGGGSGPLGTLTVGGAREAVPRADAEGGEGIVEEEDEEGEAEEGEEEDGWAEAGASPGGSGGGGVSARGAAAEAAEGGRASTNSSQRTLEQLGDAAVCGGAPAHELPFPGRTACADAPADARRRLGWAGRLHPFQGPEGADGGSLATRVGAMHRKLAARGKSWGSSTMKGGCGKAMTVRVPHENAGAGSRISKNVKASEGQLARCLKNVKHCTCEAQAAALKLPSIGKLDAPLKVRGLHRPIETCALVGNAGHLSLKEHGKYIDQHDFVVRFNNKLTTPYKRHVGEKTSLRVVNHRRSLATCCRGNFPEAKAGRTDTGVLIWYPAAQSQIKAQCKQKFPNNPFYIMPRVVTTGVADRMRLLRRDAQRLGLGPFGAWKQLSSGAHTLLYYVSLCRSVSLYGFTTYSSSSKGGGDHYDAVLSKGKTGYTVRAGSGDRWHDFKGEHLVWRLLHASGKVNVCSM